MAASAVHSNQGGSLWRTGVHVLTLANEDIATRRPTCFVRGPSRTSPHGALSRRNAPLR